jgi:hypothetical protein
MSTVWWIVLLLLLPDVVVRREGAADGAKLPAAFCLGALVCERRSPDCLDGPGTGWPLSSSSSTALILDGVADNVLCRERRLELR